MVRPFSAGTAVVPTGVVAVALVLLTAAGPALAGSASSTFTVSASVTENCTIGTTAINFGSYDPLVANVSTPLDAQGSVTITCTKGAVTTVGLDAGTNSANASGTTRAMKNGSADYLSYEIYQDSSHSTVWGSSGGALFNSGTAPSKAPRTFPTYGRIPAGQDVPAGVTYTDSVTATVNF